MLLNSRTGQTMSDKTQTRDTEPPRAARGRKKSGLSSARIRAGVVIAVAIVAGLVAWIALRHTGTKANTAVTATAATAVSPSGLASAAATAGIPIYWAGPKVGYTLEYRRTASNDVYVRYLPAGVSVGSSQAYLTIGTYPLSNAFAVTKKAAAASGTVKVEIGHGGVAFYSSSAPEHVYFAYPRTNTQVEVYDPSSAAAARSLVTAGQIVTVSSASAPSAAGVAAHAVSPAGIKTLSTSLAQPIYWVGAEKGTTYELTQTADGKIYLRYLPKGVAVGSTTAYLTIGTYPVKSAYTVVKGLLKTSGWASVKAPGKAVAGYDKRVPSSVYVAFPGSSFQIEVYSPSPARAKSLVTSGQVVAVT